MWPRRDPRGKCDEREEVQGETHSTIAIGAIARVRRYQRGERNQHDDHGDHLEFMRREGEDLFPPAGFNRGSKSVSPNHPSP